MRQKRGKSIRRKPAERFLRAVKELLAGWGAGAALIILVGAFNPGVYSPVQALIVWTLGFSPLGMLLVVKALLGRMQAGRGLRGPIDRMQKCARASVLYLTDMEELTDGSFEVEEVGAPFASEDARTLRRQSAFMFLCTACAVCCEDENAVYARQFGFERKKLCGQFPLVARTRGEDGVTRSTHLDNGVERTFASGPMDAVLAGCREIWDDTPRPLSDEDRLTLARAAASMAARGMRVVAFAMSEGEKHIFLGYTAAQAVLRAEACAQVKALKASGVRTSLMFTPTSPEERALARRAGVACPTARSVPTDVHLRTAAVLGETEAEGVEVVFARDAGMGGALQAIQQARHRLCTLVEAARSSGKASVVLGALVLSAYLARITVLWPFGPAALAVYAAIACYYRRRC